MGGAGGRSPQVNWPVARPGMTYTSIACWDCLHLRAVFHGFKAPAVAFLRSLCLCLRVAQFQGAGTSCQMATAPRLAAHYTPLPREVSGQGRGLCFMGQYEGEVGSILALLSQTWGKPIWNLFSRKPKAVEQCFILAFWWFRGIILLCSVPVLHQSHWS